MRTIDYHLHDWGTQSLEYYCGLGKKNTRNGRSLPRMAVKIGVTKRAICMKQPTCGEKLSMGWSKSPVSTSFAKINNKIAKDSQSVPAKNRRRKTTKPLKLNFISPNPTSRWLGNSFLVAPSGSPFNREIL